MNKMLVGAIVAVTVAFSVCAEMASESKVAGHHDATFVLKSHGQVVAELKVLAPARLTVSSSKMQVVDGNMTYQSFSAGSPVTVKLLVGSGHPVEIKADEIEVDRK